MVFFDFLRGISVDSQLLSPAISAQLEADIQNLPISIEKTNAHLDETIDLLRKACTRHASCELPS